MEWVGEIEERRFLIEYEIKRPVFGTVSAVSEWVRWGSYKTAEERDAEIKRLERSSDARKFRARDFSPWENRRIAF